MRGITEIELGGQKRQLRFNIAALLTFCETENIEFHQLETAFKIDKEKPDMLRMLRMMQTLVYAGMVTADQYAGRPVEYTKDQVAAWVGDLEMTEFQNVMTTCTRSMTALMGNLKAPKKGAVKQHGPSTSEV